MIYLKRNAKTIQKVEELLLYNGEYANGITYDKKFINNVVKLVQRIKYPVEVFPRTDKKDLVQMEYEYNNLYIEFDVGYIGTQQEYYIELASKLVINSGNLPDIMEEGKYTVSAKNINNIIYNALKEYIIL